MLFTVVFNVDTELPTVMPGQHMFQYAHQLYPKYVIAFNQEVLFSFIRMSPFVVKLCSVYSTNDLQKSS